MGKSVTTREYQIVLPVVTDPWRLTLVEKTNFISPHKLERLEEIKRLSSAEGTKSQMFIKDLHYLSAKSPGADFVANQIEEELSAQGMINKIHDCSLSF